MSDRLPPELLAALTALEGNQNFQRVLEWVEHNRAVADVTLDGAADMSDRELRFRLGKRAAFEEVLEACKSPREKLLRRQEQERQGEAQSNAMFNAG